MDKLRRFFGGRDHGDRGRKFSALRRDDSGLPLAGTRTPDLVREQETFQQGQIESVFDKFGASQEEKQPLPKSSVGLVEEVEMVDLPQVAFVINGESTNGREKSSGNHAAPTAPAALPMAISSGTSLEASNSKQIGLASLIGNIHGMDIPDTLADEPQMLGVSERDRNDQDGSYGGTTSSQVGAVRGVSGLCDRNRRRSSLLVRGFEGVYDRSFWARVTDKENLEGLQIKAAIREARIDWIVEMNGGSLDNGLHFILTKCPSQGETCQLVEALLSRSIDLTELEEFPGEFGPLHIAAERNFKYVAQLLLDHDMPTLQLSQNKKLAVQISLEERYDELSALILRAMPKKKVRQLFQSPNHYSEPQFSYQDILESGCMSATCSAVLDACLEPTDLPDEYRFHYRILQADNHGQTPESPTFNPYSKTGFYRILDGAEEDLLNHYVVRMIIHNKWRHYGEQRAWLHIILYVAFIVVFTVALTFAIKKPNPTSYTTTKDYIRGVLEIVSLLAILVNLSEEIGEMVREGRNFWRFPYNYLQVSSLLCALLIAPLRWNHSNAQWTMACFAYLLFALRAFKLLAITRIAGIYLQILTRILIRDISRFAVIFLIFAFAYAGSLQLSLRGEHLAHPPQGINGTLITDPLKTTKLALYSITRTYSQILLTGVRTMIEQENKVDYITDEGEQFGWLAILINLVFLFFTLVVLLNILIAQLTDTYADVKSDALRELEKNWGLALRNLDQGSLLHKRLRFYKPFEDVMHPEKTLPEFVRPSSESGGGNEEQERRQRLMEQNVDKQMQQILSVKAQLKTTLELLHENEKHPPVVKHAISELGASTLPSTLQKMLSESNNFLEEHMRIRQEQNERHLSSLHQQVEQSTTNVATFVRQSKEETVCVISEKLTKNHEDIQLIRQAMSDLLVFFAKEKERMAMTTSSPSYEVRTSRGLQVDAAGQRVDEAAAAKPSVPRQLEGVVAETRTVLQPSGRASQPIGHFFDQQLVSVGGMHHSDVRSVPQEMDATTETASTVRSVEGALAEKTEASTIQSKSPLPLDMTVGGIVSQVRTWTLESLAEELGYAVIYGEDEAQPVEKAVDDILGQMREPIVKSLEEEEAEPGRTSESRKSIDESVDQILQQVRQNILSDISKDGAVRRRSSTLSESASRILEMRRASSPRLSAEQVSRRGTVQLMRSTSESGQRLRTPSLISLAEQLRTGFSRRTSASLQERLLALESMLKETQESVLSALGTSDGRSESVEKAVQERLSAVTREITDRTQAQIAEAFNTLQQNVPRLVQAAVTQSQDDMLAALTDKLQDENSGLQEKLISEMASEFDRRQGEIDVKLADQLKQITEMLSRPK